MSFIRKHTAIAPFCIALIAVFATAAEQSVPEKLEREEARKLENPVAYSKGSIREGRKSYLRLCQDCHGFDGRAQAVRDFDAPNLRTPNVWRYGSSDGELFLTIRDGAGHDMPPFRKRLDETKTWQLVHYLRSIGPKELRPAMQP
jgi:mono/diheme cytochrome c family protein